MNHRVHGGSQGRPEKWTGSFSLHSKQVGMEFGITMLLRPKIQRNGSQFVDERLGEAVFSHVDGFDVGAATIAAFDPDVRQRIRGIDGKLGMIFLGAAGTDDPAEFPFGEAETTKHSAVASITEGTKDGSNGFAIAPRAERLDITLKLQAGVRPG